METTDVIAWPREKPGGISEVEGAVTAAARPERLTAGAASQRGPVAGIGYEVVNRIDLNDNVRRRSF